MPFAGVVYTAKCLSVHYRVRNSLSTNTTAVQIKPVNNATPSLFNIRLDSTVPSKPRSPKSPLLMMFSNYNPASIYLHMLRSSYPTSVDQLIFSDE